MLITKEQQEAWLSQYLKENHTSEECIGFVDGINKAFDFVNKNLGKDRKRDLTLEEIINKGNEVLKRQ
jgi:hypothetical protein